VVIARKSAPFDDEPPAAVGLGRVATRQDLERLEERLIGKPASEASRLDGKIDSLG
jgi:hypothetical protein